MVLGVGGFIPARGTSVAAVEETLTVDGGKIKGSTDQQGVRSYKGIPFAAPPVGARAGKLRSR